MSTPAKIRQSRWGDSSVNKLQRKVNQLTVDLEQANIALKLLMQKEKEIKTEFENKILCNVKQSVLPFVQKLKNSQLDSMQRKYVNILESNLNEMISPFLYALSKNMKILTPGEIKIVNFLKDGMDTKDIANLLNVSTRTVEYHRANIREKLGIKHKKINIVSHLNSLEVSNETPPDRG